MSAKKMKDEIEKFVKNATRNIKALTADMLVDEAAINPFLAKALGIDDFDSLARFYVYQRVGRSVVTSFGTTIEKLIEALSGGKEGKWWDVVTSINGVTYYMSVKSGPRDMDKDQVQHFARMVRQLSTQDPKAVAVIAMGYGKKPLGPIAPTLQNEGLNPNKHTLTGKQLYDKITGQKDYHKKLLNTTSSIAIQALQGRKFIQIIENKVKEISNDFRKKYKTVDDLLLDTF